MKQLIGLKPTDPLLRTICEYLSPKELRLKKTQATIDDLLVFVFTKNNKGDDHDRKKPTIIGLSANQVGIIKRICIVDLAVRKKEYSDVHVLINPNIIWYSKQQIHRREGCVNLPNIYGVVLRSKIIDVVFLDRWGNSYRARMKGWPAVLLQHEVDHLNGRLFIDRLSDPKKAHSVSDADLQSYKKSWKTWKKFVDVSSLCKVISQT